MSRLGIWTRPRGVDFDMSTGSGSSSQPSTPPLPSVAVKVTLPTPPSFSNRTRSYNSPPQHDEDEPVGSQHDSPKKGHGRSVSFSADTFKPTDSDGLPLLYRILQRHLSEETVTKSSLALSPLSSLSPGSTLSPNTTRRAIPRPLNLPSRGGRHSPLSPAYAASPVTRSMPMTAPMNRSRFSSTAAERGLSISPVALARSSNRHSVSGVPTGLDGVKSIWSPGLSAIGNNNSGWISPSLNSARSVGTLARTRGLTIGVVKDDNKELLVGDVPMTPGLASGGSGKSAPTTIPLNSPRQEDAIVEEAEEGADPTVDEAKSPSATSAEPKKREIIRPIVLVDKTIVLMITLALSTFFPIASRQTVCFLLLSAFPTIVPRQSWCKKLIEHTWTIVILCRYYHTPGLTCTSRPCRFVHNLSTILPQLSATLTSPDASKYKMLSPRTTADPTGGTFAQEQLRHNAKTLNIDQLFDNPDKVVAPGERVTLENINGDEIVGTVFLMSGGGKGPAGKSRAKFKTVACKDYAEGHCQYGEYCSFIHDERPPADKTNTDEGKPSAQVKGERRKSTGSMIKGANLAALAAPADAWKKPLPTSIRSTKPVVEKLDAGERHSNGLSAFAPPFMAQGPVSVDNSGALVMPVIVSSIVPTPVVITPAVHSNGTSKSVISPTVSAWKKNVPPALKKVSIAEPIDNPSSSIKEPLSASHLAPPVSAISYFGTESDPATPWDPALIKSFNQQMEDELEQERKDQIEVRHHEQHPEYSTAHGYVSPYPASPLGISPPGPDFYPWGIPMHPILPPSLKGMTDGFAGIPGGPGVMWTPAGWAVQDAAMKLSLRKAEISTKHKEVKVKNPKSYYKTRACRFFAEGNCPHGDSCTYLHVQSSSSSSGTSDRDSEDGLKSPILTQSHPNHRTQPCKFFNSANGCTNGDSCNFLHTFVVPPTVPLIERPRPWRTKPCRHYQLGKCTLGEACHFAHVLDPTRQSIDAARKGATSGGGGGGGHKRKPSEIACRDYKRDGRCTARDCMFSHDPAAVALEQAALTEDRLNETCERMRTMAMPASGARDGESDDEDDDLEIVTEDTSRSQSLQGSLIAA